MDHLAAVATNYSAPPTNRAVVPLSLLLVALLHGLLYLVIVPPWQHYDEPTHFEYVRLVALLGRQPGLNENDLATTRAIADSMYRSRFWPPETRPDLSSATPPNIGYNERVHPVLYYAVAAVPVRLTRFSSFEAQLYAARMVAVLLYVLVVAAAWRIATILAPDRLLLQLTIPLLLILAPAFVDQMSSVNNDSLVNFSITALLLGCVLLLRNGLRPLPLTLALLSLIVAVLAKRTALVGAVPFTLTLFWSLWRRPVRWWVWMVAIAGCCVGLGVGVFTYTAEGWAMRPWVADVNRRYLRLALNQIALSFDARLAVIENYPQLFDVLFASFWFHFGWGAVQLGAWANWAMRAVVLSSGMSLMIAAVRSGNALPLWKRRAVWLFGITVVFAWLAALVRFEAQQSIYVPRGRYLHLAIVPTIWLLALGFERLVPRRWRGHSLLSLALFFALLDIAAWAGALSNFFYR